MFTMAFIFFGVGFIYGWFQFIAVKFYKRNNYNISIREYHYAKRWNALFLFWWTRWSGRFGRFLRSIVGWFKIEGKNKNLLTNFETNSWSVSFLFPSSDIKGFFTLFSYRSYKIILQNSQLWTSLHRKIDNCASSYTLCYQRVF